jgi:predicted enzyme related to lactoylglutathione lyase
MEHHGTFGWNELITSDLEGAKRFYGDMLGWTFETMQTPQGEYTVAKLGGKSVGGMVSLSAISGAGSPDWNMPPHWFAYIMVDDVDRMVAEAQKKGAVVLKPGFDVPGVGRIVVLKDPQGAAMAWMTPVMPAGNR